LKCELISTAMAEPRPTPAKAIDVSLARELCVAGHAAEYGLTESSFSRVLRDIAAKFVPDHDTNPPQVADFLRGLRIEELALARGCAVGDEHAWIVFMNRFREKLYDAARASPQQDSSS